jgi:valyl-tRNA synthetase
LEQGIVMICSYGDHADVTMFRDLNLEPLVIVDRDGKLTSEAGPSRRVEHKGG